jgi:hypothetical protein
MVPSVVPNRDSARANTPPLSSMKIPQTLLFKPYASEGFTNGQGLRR